MPQNPNQVLPGKTPTNVPVPLNTDASGNLGTAQTAGGAPSQPNLDPQQSLRTSTIPGNSGLNIAAATVVKASPGKVHTAQVLVGGSAPGGIYDCLTTSQPSITNQMAVLPVLTTSQISALSVNMIAKVGVVVVPGTGQTVAVSFE